MFGVVNNMKAKKYAGFALSCAAALAGLTALVAAPAAAAESVRRGLALCSSVIIPSLLPFFVLSGLISALGLPQLLSRAAERPMRALFGVSGLGCVPFVLGLTGGYPVGAAAVAGLVRSGELSAREGERLLPFCNNTGPAFILGAAGAGVFGSSACGAVLYLSHILASVTIGVLFSLGHRGVSLPSAHRELRTRSFPAALSDSVKGAVGSTLNVCGFVLFFCVVTGLLDHAGIFPAAAGRLAESSGAHLTFCRALLTGLLELGGGIGAMSGLPPTPANLALCSFLLGFGGLSVHCQTLSVLEGTDMKCARHFAGRILHGLVSALLTFIAASILF